VLGIGQRPVFGQALSDGLAVRDDVVMVGDHAATPSVDGDPHGAAIAQRQAVRNDPANGVPLALQVDPVSLPGYVSLAAGVPAFGPV